MDYLGLNHLGWMRRVTHRGTDLLPGLLADTARLARLEEGQVFGAERLRALGCIPNEYLYYYYCTREAVRAILDAPQTRGSSSATSRPPSTARRSATPAARSTSGAARTTSARPPT